VLYSIALAEFAVCWVVWWYPFLFRAPHVQKRPSVAVIGATRIGLLLEAAAFFVAFSFREPSAPAYARVIPAMLLLPIAPVMAFASVRHLGRQFRIHAGLYQDHELVCTGPYSIVRHPIYSSLMAMLVCTQLLLTRWPWIAVSLAVYIAGTEIRVRTEDRLLGGRFGESFADYRRRVPAYIPFVR